MITTHPGDWLKNAREARGLTVEAIASQTKIPPRHLEAIERGDALALPAFYRRAEVRAVARALGVDEQVAVARFEAMLAPVEPPQPPPPEPTRRVRPVYVLAGLGSAALIVGLAGWGSFERATSTQDSVGTRGAVTVPQPAAMLPREVESASVVQPVAASVSDPTVAPSGPTELVVRTQPAGARVTVNGIGWGVSPLTIRHVEPGEKHIRVSMDGYASIERTVMLDEGSSETVRLTLSSTSGS